MRVTAQRVAVVVAVAEHPHRTTDEIDAAVRAELGAVSRQAVYDALAALDRRRRAAPDPARGVGRPLRGPGRGQPPPPHLPAMRPDRRRRLRGRRGSVPHRGRRRRLRGGRGRGHLLGPLPRLRRGDRLDRRLIDDAKETAVSESENPAIPAPEPEAHGPRSEPRLVARSARPDGAPPQRRRGRVRSARTTTTPRSSPSSTSTRCTATSKPS